MEEVQSHVVTESSTAALGGGKTTTRLQICGSRGKRARAQLKVVSHQLMEESLSSPRRGSRSLLNPSSCMIRSKYMSTNVLMLSQS